MKTSFFALFSIAAISSILVGSLLPAQAQSFGGFSIPPSASPGAVLRHDYNYMFLRQTQPYLFGPIQGSDAGIQQPAEPPVQIEPGVLPERRSVQGVLTTPGGRTIISPQSP